MMQISIWCLNRGVISTIKASKIFMLYYEPFRVNPLNNVSITKMYPLLYQIIPFILAASAHYEPR